MMRHLAIAVLGTVEVEQELDNVVIDGRLGHFVTALRNDH
jgi:hypothetical protein